jgi:hypothetical protein
MVAESWPSGVARGPVGVLLLTGVGLCGCSGAEDRRGAGGVDAAPDEGRPAPNAAATPCLLGPWQLEDVDDGAAFPRASDLAVGREGTVHLL